MVSWPVVGCGSGSSGVATTRGPAWGKTTAAAEGLGKIVVDNDDGAAAGPADKNGVAMGGGGGNGGAQGVAEIGVPQPGRVACGRRFFGRRRESGENR